jgi:epoxide hydrolase-like predicted phosphatase
MIKALISDLGGVLLRTRTAGSRRALEQRLGLAPHTIEARVFGSDLSLQAQRGEVGEEIMWRALERDLDLPHYGLTVREFRNKFFEEDFIDEELLNLIRRVRPGLKTGLLSNAWDGLREMLQTQIPVSDAFDVIVISAEEKIAKPDPRLYQLALTRLGVQADEAIFLDDLSENVDAARALGLIGIHFQSSEQAQRDIRARLNGLDLPAR